MDLTDVVHADVPIPVLAGVGVGESAGLGVLFEDQDPLARVFGELGSDGEAADAGADHDHIVSAVIIPFGVGHSGLFHRSRAATFPGWLI